MTPEQQTQLTKVMDGLAKSVTEKYGNTTGTTWEIDGVKYAKITQTGFSGDKIQTFEGTVDGRIYTGTLIRNDGRVLE